MLSRKKSWSCWLPQFKLRVATIFCARMSRNLSLLGPEYSRGNTRSRTLFTSSSGTYLEDASDEIGSCNDLIHTLIHAGVSGPLLFRLQSEFNTLEDGGQSDILKAKEEIVEKIQRARKVKHLSWLIDSIVIKRHRPRPDSDSSAQLATHFLAARQEVLALSHQLFQNHPNIVQLKAWGLCLDNIEQPKQQSLQVPLLILERAEADLEYFLQDRARYSVTRPHALRIRLCQDIGTGLEILHQNGFTHGDLKPKNILVFQTHGRWVAKLCDFGCSQRHASEPPARPHPGGETETPRPQATYLGTRNWLPPEVASSTPVTKFDHLTLQRCDIFVYGMVVWSMLCKDGKSCTSNDLKDPKETWTQANREIKIALRTEPDFLSMVQKTLTDCLCHANERSLTPWDNLRTRSIPSAMSGKVKQMLNELTYRDLPSVARTLERTATNLDFIRGKRIHIPSPKRPNLCQPLDPEQKALYESQEWWNQQDISTYGTMLVSQSPQAEDGNPRSISTFHEPRGEEEVKKVYNDIVSSIGNSTTHRAIRLYCCARFRSRISLSEWESLNLTQNLVQIALQSRPTPELSTLAWLCRGEVGIHEVKSLPRNFYIWNTILDPTILNESERLERFLLLVQSGAEIEKELPPSETWIDHGQKRSILFEYIRSSRRAVVGTIMREILSKMDNIKREKHISEDTKCYLTGRGRRFPMTALGHFVDAVNFEAVSELLSVFDKDLLDAIQESDLAEPIHVIQSPETYRLEYRRDAQQVVSLLLGRRFSGSEQFASKYLSPVIEDVEGHQGGVRQMETSPVPGWEVIKVNINDDDIELYQDVITRSITLQKPCVNFLADSQVRIGYQDQPGRSFYLRNLSSFFQSNSNAEDFKDRFPTYTTEWFNKEQGVSPPTEDILGTLRDRWRIPSLTETVDITWLSYVLSLGQRIFSISWMTLLLYGFRVLPLVALLAHKAK